MRGSGKTFIGKQAARALEWTFLDADVIFEERHKTGVKQFVQDHGWPAFRTAETEILRELLKSSASSKEHIISLGGGIVETPTARELLKEYNDTTGPVVHIAREIDEIVKYLGEETARPAYGEPVVDVFRRREPWFAECSTHEFVNCTDVSMLAGNLRGKSEATASGLSARALTHKTAEQGFRNEVDRFFRHITGQRPNLVENIGCGRRSYFLSLTYPDVTPALPLFDQLTVGVDAVEVRVDLLRTPEHLHIKRSYIPPISYVVKQLNAVRQCTTLPIVFTVRSEAQGGCHPDGAEDEAFALFDIAIRMGCEYIDVEITWSNTRIVELRRRKGHSQVITSWHDWSGNVKWDGPQLREIYERVASLGDITKIVCKATSLEDNFALHSFVTSVNRTAGAKPLIAINTAYEGQMSRILNSTMTPVTHPLLEVSAAPGQLSFTQIQELTTYKN